MGLVQAKIILTSVIVNFLVGFGLYANNKNSDHLLHYRGELSWIYFDRFSPNELFSQIAEPPGVGSDENRENRSFGLQKASLELRLVHPSKTALAITLRPDALATRSTDSSASSRAAVDTRAGEVRHEESSIEFLDSYLLEFRPSQNFKLSLGVFSELERSWLNYGKLLEFGLNARLPDKFAGLRILWSTASLQTSTEIKPVSERFYEISLTALQGRGDRAEILADNDESFDTGPAAKDPYSGGAVNIKVNFERPWQLGLNLGYADAKVVNGRRSESWGRLSIKHTLGLKVIPTDIVYEANWNRERWRLVNAQLPELEQLSHSLEINHSITPRVNIFWLLAIGHSDQISKTLSASKTEFDGQMVELGVETRLYRHLSLQTAVSSEVREETLDGEKSGGFNQGSNEKKQLTRLALRLQYLLVD